MRQLEEDRASESQAPAWKARLDIFATGLMIGGGSSETIGQLREFATEARIEGRSEFIQIIDSVIAKLDKDLEGGIAYLMGSGIDELQAALIENGTKPTTSMTSASLGEDAELISDFIVEAREHLSQIEGQMLTLERDPSDMEVIHAVFRAFHTIKGLAGFLDFANVQALAHEVETLLDLARNEKLTVTPPIVDVVLESGDFLQGELLSIERALTAGSGVETVDNQALVNKIRRLATPQNAQTVSPPTLATPIAVVATIQNVPVPVKSEGPAAIVDTPPKAKKSTSKKKVSTTQTFESPDGTGFVKIFSAADRAAMLTASMAESVKTMAPPAPDTVLMSTLNGDAVNAHAAVPTAALETGDAAPSLKRPLVEVKQASIEKEPARAANAQASAVKELARPVDAGSVRVETAKLDHLMDMVGEVVIAQSLIRHNHAFAASTDSRLMADIAHLARVTGEVQRATMSMRMVPVGQLFQRVERVIRDLSRKAGKLVILETSGSETEIDKTVAEELSDPLLHMVRNSVDHGIEGADERLAAGKSSEARIKLSARHQGGQVIIEISDDGRGLNSEKIRRKAEERHLVTASTQLSETEVYQLIFEPGFSTAEKITDVSGRGVGMDVVRRNVEKLRGRIETQSTLGAGTTFSLRLPLTLAIIDGLVVEVGSERYIIPLSGVREIFRPQEEALFTMEMRDEMLLVRGQLMPVVRLGQRLGIEAKAVLPSEGLIVVVECQNRCFCLLVDDLFGKQEVVIKSLGETFKDVSGLSGCAVLGDGRVGLILDIDGIYRGGR